MSFDVCDKDGDGGLTWQEVEDCIVSITNQSVSRPISIKHISIFQDAYGAFINVDKLPSKEDFEMFDTNEDGTLYYDEWAEAQ